MFLKECSSCKLHFGSEYSKHHCRGLFDIYSSIIKSYIIFLACGHVFCDTCTTHRRVVPWIDTKRPVRVCNNCNDKLQSQTLSSVFQNNHLYSQQNI